MIYLQVHTPLVNRYSYYWSLKPYRSMQPLRLNAVHCFIPPLMCIYFSGKKLKLKNLGKKMKSETTNLIAFILVK